MSNEERIDQVFRNIYGKESDSLEQTKLNDLRFSHQLKETYAGDSNGELLALTSLEDGQMLLLPNFGSFNYRHTVSQTRPQIYYGGKIFAAAFHPHRKSILAVAIDDPQNKPSGIAIVICQYDRQVLKNFEPHQDQPQQQKGKFGSSQDQDLAKVLNDLNSSLKVLATYKAVHSKRGIDIFWHPHVSDLLYSIGNEEVVLLSLTRKDAQSELFDVHDSVNNFEKEDYILQKLATYQSESPAFVSDACVSKDGRFLLACFTGKSTGQRGNTLQMFPANYSAIAKARSANQRASSTARVHPLTLCAVSQNQSVKLCAVSDKLVVVSRSIMGKREIALIELKSAGDNSFELKEVHSFALEGSATMRLQASSSMHPIFYTFGKGDSSVCCFCVFENEKNEMKLSLLGSLMYKQPIQNIIYLPEYCRQINQFEIQRLFLFTKSGGNNSFSSFGVSASFILPRRGDPYEVGCYSPLLYFQSSGTLEQFMADQQLELNLIDPIDNDEMLQSYCRYNKDDEDHDLSNLNNFRASTSDKKVDTKLSNRPNSTLSQSNSASNAQYKANTDTGSRVAKSQSAPLASSLSAPTKEVGSSDSKEVSETVASTVPSNPDDKNSPSTTTGGQVPQRTNHLNKKLDDILKKYEDLAARVEKLERSRDIEKNILEDL